jgi:CelD/BcsL family acetyltransferase involved in cellulose biosynthesis
MEILRVDTCEQFQSLEATWTTLNRRGPMCSWQWLFPWWHNYSSASRELFLLIALSPEGEPVGIAPWFLTHECDGGRTIRLLGDGEVCSENVGILAAPADEEDVIAAIAGWLVDASTKRGPDRWDQMTLECVPTADEPTQRLLERLATSGCRVHRRADVGLWKIDLPASWDEYAGRFSKNRRKRLRRYHRAGTEDGIQFRRIERTEQLEYGLETLFELHRKRREAMNEECGFCSPQHLQFIRDAAPLLLEAGELQLALLERDNQPIAVEFALRNDHTTYVYQSGIDPEASELSPGNIITTLFIEDSICAGRRRYDFLRGDEPYKSTWGACRRDSPRIRVAANRFIPQLRQVVWLAGATVKDAVRSRLYQPTS